MIPGAPFAMPMPGIPGVIPGMPILQPMGPGMAFGTPRSAGETRGEASVFHR